MPDHGALQTLLLVLPLLLGGALWAGIAIGRARERDRLVPRSRADHREALGLSRLHAADLLWRCDERLQLTSLEGALAADWPAARPGARLDLLLQSDEAPSLSERLLARGELLDLRVHRNGEPQPWSLTAVPRHDDEGRFAGYLGVIRRAGTAEAAQRLSAQSAAAEDALSFSYTVSHDLRAPLRVVEGFARILKEDHGSQLDRVGNDHLDRVLGAAARMNQMIDALLAMARLASQPMARQPVDLSQLAQFVVEELRRGAPERQIELSIEPGLQVLGDPTLLRQVLENLLGNAWKYTARAAAPSVSFGRQVVGGRTCFVVRDNGAGFDMRGADRLFGLFQRLHSASEFPGTGVGLASVKRIIARHGGRIWAESEPGRGASFSFTLWE
jgi:light-regulated signal transduction histidine kinase (bacteriophytochrome)